MSASTEKFYRQQQELREKHKLRSAPDFRRGTVLLDDEEDANSTTKEVKSTDSRAPTPEINITFDSSPHPSNADSANTGSTVDLFVKEDETANRSNLSTPDSRKFRMPSPKRSPKVAPKFNEPGESPYASPLIRKAQTQMQYKMKFIAGPKAGGGISPKPSPKPTRSRSPRISPDLPRPQAPDSTQLYSDESTNVEQERSPSPMIVAWDKK